MKVKIAIEKDLIGFNIGDFNVRFPKSEEGIIIVENNNIRFFTKEEYNTIEELTTKNEIGGCIVKQKINGNEVVYKIEGEFNIGEIKPCDINKNFTVDTNIENWNVSTIQL